MTSEAYYFWLGVELVVFVFILVPTMIAFVTGAPWIPTPMARIKRMLELAELKGGEKVYDIGCGDGRLPYLAAKLWNADAVGIELSPLVFAWARVRHFFWRSKCKLILRDFRYYDLSDANVLAFYLLPEILKKMRPKFEAELKPGTKIISYAFEIAGWTPVHIEPKNMEKNLARIMVYEIPQPVKVEHLKIDAVRGV
jgi:SAM-dependent methyltransferase